MNSIFPSTGKYSRTILLLLCTALIGSAVLVSRSHADSSLQRTAAVSHTDSKGATSGDARVNSFFAPMQKAILANSQTQSRFTPSALTLTVNDISDGHDGNPGDGLCDTGVGFTTGACTLRAAIEEYEASAAGAGSTINFNLVGLPVIISASSAYPALTKNVTITGLGANLLNVRGNATFTMFTINSGVTVSISGLSIEGGHSTSSTTGGGITNSGTLTLTACNLQGSVATNGGAINGLSGSTTTINDSSIIGNQATANGTGVFGSVGSTVNLNNSTVALNTGGFAGVVTNGGTLTITSSTITTNTSPGVFASGSASLYNTIVTSSISGADVSGGFTSNGHNLITNAGSATGFTNGVNGDIVGSSANLAPLADFGGPTLTSALVRGNFGDSVAIDAGNNTSAPATDQRGVARPFNGTVDIGAFEAQIDMTPTNLPSGSINTAYSTSMSGINGTGPYTFSIYTGSLPNGVTLASDGTLSGTPTQSGSFTVGFEAKDASGIGGARLYGLFISNTATKLAITSVNSGSNPTAFTPFSVSVQSQDGSNVSTPVTADTAVTLSLNTGTGTLGGTLTGTITAETSSVTISGVTYNKAEGGVSITATRTSGDNLTAGNSASFTVNAPPTVFTDPSGFCSANTPCFTNIQTAISAVASGGTVNIGAGLYGQSVNFNASATYSINGNVTLSGVNISSGTVNAGSATITDSGSWSFSGGTFNAGTSTVSFGGGAVLGGSGATTFNNLTIGGSTSLSQDETVSGILTLTGDLDTSGFTLIMPSTGSSTGTGDVVGTVKRTGFVSGGVALSFGNQFNTIAINSGTAPTDISITLTKTVPTDSSTGQTNSGFAVAITRTYLITPNGGSGISATVQLHYKDSELNGNTESGLNLFRFNSGTGKWENQSSASFTPGGTTTRDTTNNFVSQSGVSGFSPWTLNSTVPTAVDFDCATVTRIGKSAVVQWKTGMEVNNLGFNVYRQSGGDRAQVNPSMIAGTALMVGGDVRVESGYTYSWTDDNPSPGAMYWIEDVDLSGRSTWHGPFSVSSSSTKMITRTRSVLLNNLNSNAARQTNSVIQTEYPAQAGNSGTVSTQSATNGRTPTKPTSIPASLQKQWQIASQSAVKIAINKTGWYKVSAADLFAAGLNANGTTASLQMFVGGVEIPIRINSADGLHLDSVEFYGVGLNTPTSDTQVYWLTSGSGTGKRINVQQSPGSPNSNIAPSFQYTIERKDRNLYFSSLRNGDTENWFGPVVSSNAVSQTINVHNHDANVNGQAQIEAALQGVTLNAHRVNVTLNGQAINTMTFEALDNSAMKISIPESSLVEGNNQITFAAQNSGDVSLIDYVRITYAHNYVAENNALTASVGGLPIKVSGFTTNQIRAIDVANPNQPVEVEGTIDGEAGNYTLSIGPAKHRNLVIFTPDKTLQPLSIIGSQPSRLNNASNGADFVIITNKDFAASVQPLAALRQSQGYQVTVVDVDNIYDEFNYGVHSPYAIRDFLNWTYTRWQKQPQFVMLAGSGTIDPRNYTGLGFMDFVPTKLIDTGSMETASDDWFVDFNDNGKPQMSIGRLPVHTAAEATLVVNKIMSYEQSNKTEAVVLVSDINDGVDFNSANNQIKSLVPRNLSVVTINRDQTGTDAKGVLLDQLNRGGRIINYAGHGSVNLWRGALLTDDDMASLANHQISPLVVTMTCLNGYFQDPNLASLGESLLKVNQGGAVSVWASSGMTDAGNQTAMNQEFFRQLFGNQSVTIGEAIKAAKNATDDNDIRRTWILFGDPTMRIK